MSKQDYYATLEVEKTASAEDLKRAYRKLAMQHHPDRNPDDPEAERKFKEINEAYAILKDDKARAAYDRFGHAAFENSVGPGGPGGFDFTGFADIFDEMFGEFMGGRRGNGGVQHGADLRYNMEIELEDAYAGKTSQIRVPTSVTCESCLGSGAESGSKPTACPSCQGPVSYTHLRAHET